MAEIREDKRQNRLTGEIQCAQAEINAFFGSGKKSFENEKIAIQTISQAGTIRRWDNSSEEIYGYASSEALGRRIQDLLLSKKESNDFENMLLTQWQHKEDIISNCWNLITKNGRVISGSIALAAAGEGETLCINYDISETDACDKCRSELQKKIVDLVLSNNNLRQQMAELKISHVRLKESEREYRELVESSNSIMIRRNVMGNIQFINEYALIFFGYTREEIIGRNVVGTIVPETDSSGHDLAMMIQDINKNPQCYVGNVNENMRKDGERVWVAWTNKPLFNDKGEVVEILCIGNDITERRKNEEKLREKMHENRELESEILRISEREKRLIGQELHDTIGQQLSGISLMARVLSNNLAKRSLSDAEAVGEIEKLVRQTLWQTRHLARGLHPVDVDPSGLMSGLSMLAENACKMFEMECRFECSGDIYIDNSEKSTHLYRIAQEAITNAHKHGKAKNVTITLERKPENSILSILSDGEDFPENGVTNPGMGLRIMEYRSEAIGGTAVKCEFSNSLLSQK